MPDYHPIYLTGENVSFKNKRNRVTITGTFYHHGGTVLYTLDKVDETDKVMVPEGMVKETQLIDTEYGWPKIDAFSSFKIEAIFRNNHPYVLITHRKTGIELFQVYEPSNERIANDMAEVAKVRDATMFAQRYGFSVQELDL